MILGIVHYGRNHQKVSKNIFPFSFSEIGSQLIFIFWLQTD